MNIPAFQNFPAELAMLPRWVVWRSEPRFAGESPTKIPYDAATGFRAKSNDPTTWTPLAVVREVFERSFPRFTGVGFVLGDDAPYCGIDLDACRDPATGAIAPRATKIINRFSTYWEISQSLCGAKGIMRATMPTPDGRGKNYRKDPWGTGTGGIEMYRRGRFFALTGNVLAGTPSGIAEGTGTLADLYRQLCPPLQQQPHTTAASDVAAADRIRRCAAYVDKIAPSVAGQGGHDRLLRAACLTVQFDVPDADAISILHAYNRRADPPWDARDIERKLTQAKKLAGNERGIRLAQDRHPQRRHPRRRIMLIGGDE